MDNTKWTSRLSTKRARYALIATTTLLTVTIISHFCVNHTQTTTEKIAPQDAWQQTIPLPKESTPKGILHTAPSKSETVVTKTLRFRSSIIHHSIEGAARAAGLPEHMAHEVFAMFSANGIAQEIHPGDRLNILYHEYFVGNQKNHPGNVVAAEIIDGKHDYRMVRFTAPNNQTGFYTPNGNDTKPLFLRIPLHYERIGSRFTYHRMDPVLHKIRPHLGVDFDAPIGTPVKAIGNGIVVFCKQMRGYGNVLMIRYGNTYKSLYAHLEKFASYVKPNERVKKGEIVGYVGKTGWTTGPHLHFAIYKNGVAVNPLTVQFPHGSFIPAKYRSDFLYKEHRWFSQMQLYESALHLSQPRIKRIAHSIRK